MDKYMHTYIHTYIHPYIHTSIHPSIHPYIHTYKNPVSSKSQAALTKFQTLAQEAADLKAEVAAKRLGSPAANRANGDFAMI